MNLSVLSFPPGFLWGTACSAYQVEGDNRNNDWWIWEQTPGHISDGSGAGLACDWWRAAEQDFDLATRMGQNAQRLSIEWSRVEPQEGAWSGQAFARYREMLIGLRQRGIEPMVTLHHFTNPLWLVGKGGWETEEVVPLFIRYVGRVVGELGDLVSLWCTINEPNVYAYESYLKGVAPPGKSDLTAALRVLRTMLLAHGQAYQTIHSLSKEARVGIAHHVRVFEPAHSASIPDRWVARILDSVFNELAMQALATGVLHFPLSFLCVHVPALVDSMDYIGLNYYTRDLVAFDYRKPGDLFARFCRPEAAPMSDGDYGEVHPSGLYAVLKRYGRYGKPIYVTENGLPDSDDDQRPSFLLSHLASLHRAVSEGVDVRGYFHWTLVDNFEWSRGWSLRFGLVELDRDSQGRRLRRSGELYSEICTAGAISEDMVMRYAPDLAEGLIT